MWSVPPADPPAIDTAWPRAFMSFTRSLIVWYGEFAGTTTISSSAVSRAIGVVFSSVAWDWLVSIAPTITRPITIR